MTFAEKFIKKFDAPLSKTIGYIRDGTSYLTPKDDWVEGLRRRFALSLDPFTRPFDRPAIRKKGAADYVTTVKTDPDAVETLLMGPYQRNLLSTRKYRKHHSGDRQWACGSFVIDGIETDKPYKEQHHVYLFEVPNGRTDVYAHLEPSVKAPNAHQNADNQNQGAPHILFDLFDRGGVEYSNTTRLK